MKTVHYDVLLDNYARIVGILKGETELLTSHENWQFEDYSKMNAAVFDVEARAKRRAEVFPVDCRKAFEMGARWPCPEHDDHRCRSRSGIVVLLLPSACAW